MCLAIPARILSIEGTTARVDVQGNLSTADIMLLPQVVVGDYVIVHAGMAIERYDEQDALETLALFDEMRELQQDETSGGASA